MFNKHISPCLISQQNHEPGNSC